MALLVVIALVAISSGSAGSVLPQSTLRTSGAALSTSSTAPTTSSVATTNLDMSPSASCTALLDGITPASEDQMCDGKVWISSAMEVPKLGYGYTPASGITAGIPAADVATGYTAPSSSAASGYTCTKCVQQVSSYQAADSWLKGNLGLKLGNGAFSASANAHFDQNTSDTQTSGLFVAKLQCMSEMDATPLKLNQFGDLCASQGYPAFIGMFGQCVVTSLSYGYELNIVIDLSSMDESTQQTFGGNLTLGFGSVGHLSIGGSGGNSYTNNGKTGQIYATSFGLDATGMDLVPNGPFDATAIANVDKLLANFATYAENNVGAPMAFMTKPWADLSDSCHSNFNRSLCLSNIESDYMNYKSAVDTALTKYQEGLTDPGNYYRHAAELYIYHKIGDSSYTVETKQAVQFGVSGEQAPGPTYNQGVTTDTSTWKEMVYKLEQLQDNLKNFWSAYQSSKYQETICDNVYSTFWAVFDGEASTIGYPGSPTLTDVQVYVMQAPTAECPMGSCSQCSNKDVNNMISTGAMSGAESGDVYTNGATWGPSAPLCCRGDQMQYKCYCWNQAVADVGLMCSACFCCGGAAECPSTWGGATYVDNTLVLGA